MSELVSPVSSTVKESGGEQALRARPKKAPNAFRTISEVADDLHIPQHVLRFWETKFPQVRPLKRGGGRRYYRPDDIGLLRRIADLLYTQGYTIKGVQRLLREGGGQLSDDIPPPTADERAAAEAEKADLSAEDPLLIPGLELVPPSVAQMVRPTPRPKPDAENERLRALLAEGAPDGPVSGELSDAVVRVLTAWDWPSRRFTWGGCFCPATGATTPAIAPALTGNRRGGTPSSSACTAGAGSKFYNFTRAKGT